MNRPQLAASGLAVAYGQRRVLDQLTLPIPDGSITAIVGPNGCGKSTLLRALARVLAPTAGAVLLDGAPIHRMPTRDVARLVGLLPQSALTPEDLTVEELVRLGRHPHRGAFGGWRAEDREAVEDALAATSTVELRDRRVDELSGGQRQRAWIAMVLAQRTPVLLLDEPTTFLDLAYRLEVLELLRRLNEERGVTVVMVLHDLNEACRYADHLVALRDGALVDAGPPPEVVDPELVERVFGVRCAVTPDPVTATPMVVPLPLSTPSGIG
jgi:ABC-type cobalamin/Fe3+-siderophores transport system ATPase subunit